MANAVIEGRQGESMEMVQEAMESEEVAEEPTDMEEVIAETTEETAE